MNFINNPNLPIGNVKYLVCDSRVDQKIKNELITLGIKIIPVPCDDSLQTPVSAHADLHLLHLGENKLLLSTHFAEHFLQALPKEASDCEIFNNRESKIKLRKSYPFDVPLNAAIIGDTIICNKKTVCKKVLDTDKCIINVKQGYAKCSVVPVSEKAIITDDINIYNEAKELLDVLYLEKGFVQLNGYNYGFIGGCSGKLSKDTIAFTGNLDLCSSKDDIKCFCKNHSVSCISLSKAPLYDYGSLLPIIEM